MELALEALLDDHAAHLAVEVAKDVVEVGAPCVGGDGGGFTLEVGGLEDGSGAAVIGRSGLWD